MELTARTPLPYRLVRPWVSTIVVFSMPITLGVAARPVVSRETDLWSHPCGRPSRGRAYCGQLMSEPHGGAAGRNAGWGAGDGEGAPFKGGGREPVRYLDVPEQLSKLHAGLVLLAIPTRRTGRLVG